MIKRPLSLTILCLVYLGVAISLPVQVALRFEHGFFDFYSIAIKISSLSYAIMALCVLCAYLSWTARTALFVVGPLLVAMVTWNNFLLVSYDPSASLIAASLSSFLFAAVSALVLEPRARLVLSSPEKRWWRAARRRRVALPAVVNAGDKVIETSTHDLSLSGAFLAGSDSTRVLPGQSSPLDCDDPVEIVISLPRGRTLQVKGEVVRFTQKSAGTYPAGFGVRFKQLGTLQRLSLWASVHLGA